MSPEGLLRCTRPFLAALVAMLGAAPRHAAAQATVLASVGDAYVASDERAGAWAIGNASVRYVVEAGAASFKAIAVSRPGTTDQWDLQPGPDMTFVADRRQTAPGESGFGLRESRADIADGAVRLSFGFESAALKLRVTRTYSCHPRVPFVETWSTFETLGAPSVSIQGIDVWRLTAPGTTLNWVTGLKAPTAEGGPFTRRSQAIAAGRVDLGATGRSSEQQVPVFWVDGEPGHLIGAVAWSGMWALSASDADSGRVALRLSLGDTRTAVRAGEAFETPHGFIGVAKGDPAEVSAALWSLIVRSIRRGRAFKPAVTYNSWFPYGTHTNEDAIKEEMRQAAELGVELFVLDAGWYPTGSDMADFTTGLGLWAADPRRFPSGLGSLGDYARSLGLKFGIWVEPERVDVATVNRAGLAKERFLATAGGRYNPAVKSSAFAQICLGDAEARQWVLDQLIKFIDQVRPDYLKWDNNFWINCDRGAHGHGASDGNLTHVQGLYAILAELRARYPALRIENCAAGGNRLDLGLLRYTDAAWMDDYCFPAARVRHHLEGLGAIFPPAYLLSFVIAADGEPLHHWGDLSLYFGSRMAGVLGITYKSSELEETDRERIKVEIGAYRRIRPLVAEAVSALLTPQVPVSGGTWWDAVELRPMGRGTPLVLAFDNDGGSSTLVVHPVGLQPDATYLVRATPGGRLGEGLGSEWIDGGVEVARSSATRAHVVTFRLQAPGS